jgi:hypothetical protein
MKRREQMKCNRFIEEAEKTFTQLKNWNQWKELKKKYGYKNRGITNAGGVYSDQESKT